MASDRFGQIFCFTTFGESHGNGIGVVIDGCPAGLELSLEDFIEAIERRKPKSQYSTPRMEADLVEILSGTFEGKTTGAPISIWIPNQDVKTSSYEPIKDIHRVGHANFSYLQKYGIFDYRGGGRASARETIARVVAASVARKLLGEISVKAEVVEVGGERDAEKIEEALRIAKEEGDSLGAVIACSIENVPAGLGEPIYDKLEARLASAMMSIPATRGVEFGEGFGAAQMRGSEHNDEMRIVDDQIVFSSNHHGGIQGGISTGEPILFRVAFKPTSSIRKKQTSVTLDGKEKDYQLPKGSRHDVCVALRAPVIVESMAQLVLADFVLINRCAKFPELVN